MRRLFFLIIFSFLFVSCKTIPIVAEIIISLGNEVQQSNPKNDETSQKTTVDSIRQKVLEYAYMYCNSDTEYAWGGQDMIRSIKGEVIYSTFDELPEHHVKVAEIVLEKILVE
jgi:hypothetical protein